MPQGEKVGMVQSTDDIYGLTVPASGSKAIIELVETRAYFGAGDSIWSLETVK